MVTLSPEVGNFLEELAGLDCKPPPKKFRFGIIRLGDLRSDVVQVGSPDYVKSD